MRKQSFGRIINVVAPGSTADAGVNKEEVLCSKRKSLGLLFLR